MPVLAAQIRRKQRLSGLTQYSLVWSFQLTDRKSSPSMTMMLRNLRISFGSRRSMSGRANPTNGYISGQHGNNTCGGGQPSFYEGQNYLVFVKEGQAYVHLCGYTAQFHSLPEEWKRILGPSKPIMRRTASPIPERVGEPVSTPTVPASAKVVQPTSEPTVPAPAKVVQPTSEPTVPAPAKVVQPTSEPTAPAPAQDAQTSSGCNSPLGYAPNDGDLSAFGLIAPLAWLAWRRRSLY